MFRKNLISLCLLFFFGDQEVSEVRMRSGTPGRRDNFQTNHSFFLPLFAWICSLGIHVNFFHKAALLKNNNNKVSKLIKSIALEGKGDSL